MNTTSEDDLRASIAAETQSWLQERTVPGSIQPFAPSIEEVVSHVIDHYLVAYAEVDHQPEGWDGPYDQPLVHDLANVLAGSVVGWRQSLGIDLAEAPEVKRVLARYRKWSQEMITRHNANATMTRVYDQAQEHIDG